MLSSWNVFLSVPEKHPCQLCIWEYNVIFVIMWMMDENCSFDFSLRQGKKKLFFSAQNVKEREREDGQRMRENMFSIKWYYIKTNWLFSIETASEESKRKKKVEEEKRRKKKTLKFKQIISLLMLFLLFPIFYLSSSLSTYMNKYANIFFLSFEVKVN